MVHAYARGDVTSPLPPLPEASREEYDGTASEASYPPHPSPLPWGRPGSALPGTRTTLSRPFSAALSSVSFQIQDDEDCTSYSGYSHAGGGNGSAALAAAMLTGGQGRSPGLPARPAGVTPLLGSVLDAAHWQQATRKLSHPITPVYAAFDGRQQAAVEASSHYGATKRVSEWANFLEKTPGSAVNASRVYVEAEEAGEAAAIEPPFPPAGLSVTSQANPNLEVVCQYDCNFQSGDIQGRDGGKVRPPGHASIGPVNYMFRWYTKRGTLFAATPTVEDLVGCPALPPLELLPSEAAQKGSRHLNQALDPLMSLGECLDMVEELDIMPGMLCRRDVTLIFRACLTLPPPPAFAAAALAAAASGNRIARSQIHPDELRFPAFCDLLIRLAVAAAQAAAPPLSPVAAAAAGPTREMSLAKAGAALKLFMDSVGVSTREVHELKAKLDALARSSKERCVRRVDEKWKHVAIKSVLSAPPLPTLPGAWTPLSATPAAEPLLQRLLDNDVVFVHHYTANWREFAAPALALGRVLPGELRSMRLVLRNRSDRLMLLRVDCSDAPWLTLVYNEQALVPGVQRVINIEVRFTEVDEYVGELRIFTRPPRDSAPPFCNVVPVYALCGPPDASGRAVSRSRSGRTDLVSRAGTAARRPHQHTTASTVMNRSLSTPRSSSSSRGLGSTFGGNSTFGGGSTYGGSSSQVLPTPRASLSGVVAADSLRSWSTLGRQSPEPTGPASGYASYCSPSVGGLSSSAGGPSRPQSARLDNLLRSVFARLPSETGGAISGGSLRG